MSWHSWHTVNSVCVCSLNRRHQTLLGLPLSSVCSWSKVGFIYMRSSQLRVRSCANVRPQSCKQKTAGFRTYKCAVGILWVTHWSVTCHLGLWVLVVVTAQNYKSQQEQMEVVSLNTIPEKSTFKLKPTQQVLLKHINKYNHFISYWYPSVLPIRYIGRYSLSRRLNNVQITSLKVTVMQIHRLKQSIYSS